MATGAELTYNTGASALQMAETIFGDGVTVLSATYSGDPRSSAIYSNGDALSPEATPADTGVILSTGFATSFTQSSGDPNRSSGTSTNTNGINNNADFNAIAGTSTYDAAYIDASFIPTGDTMTISFTFASEEYPEYTNSIYNDIVGVWVNGSYVSLGIGDGNTSVTNVNGTSNENLYISNTGDQYNTEMDGFTVTMTLTFPVNAGVTNTIRIGIADASDATYDSAILIAADSAQTVLIAEDDQLTMAPDRVRTIDVLGNDANTTGGTLSITAINGIAVNPGDTVTLGSGEQVTLNADGTLSVTSDAGEENVNFTYEVTSSTGQYDTGLVTLDIVPCFTAGTRIATPDGPRAVEDLRPGDLVLTQDEGPQPLRWTGRRRVAAEGAMAPVRIAAGRFGAHGALSVSPQHRVVVRDARAELLFDAPEVLVAAKDLIDGRLVTRAPGGFVEYIHLLFDRHQVIFAEGLATESFLPGPRVIGAMDRAVQAEICALFPELDPETGAGYGACARPTLRGYEARLLAQELAA